MSLNHGTTLITDKQHVASSSPNGEEKKGDNESRSSSSCSSSSDSGSSSSGIVLNITLLIDYMMSFHSYIC